MIPELLFLEKRVLTCEQLLLLRRERDDGISLLDSEQLLPAKESLTLQPRRVRAAESQQQRSSSVVFPLSRGELSGPSTSSDVGGKQRGGMRVWVFALQSIAFLP